MHTPFRRMFARSIGSIEYFGGSPITLAFPSMSLQELSLQECWAGSHHNIAMDSALNPALLDPRLPRVGQSRLPAPAGNSGTALAGAFFTTPLPAT
jgi:hypothetical protein